MLSSFVLEVICSSHKHFMQPFSVLNKKKILYNIYNTSLLKTTFIIRLYL